MSVQLVHPMKSRPTKLILIASLLAVVAMFSSQTTFAAPATPTSGNSSNAGPGADQSVRKDGGHHKKKKKKAAPKKKRGNPKKT